MFTEKKFKSLEPQLRCRKAARILKDAEEALRRGCPVDTPYLEMILRNALEEPEVRLENTSQGFFLRSINSFSNHSVPYLCSKNWLQRGDKTLSIR